MMKISVLWSGVQMTVFKTKTKVANHYGRNGDINQSELTNINFVTGVKSGKTSNRRQTVGKQVTGVKCGEKISMREKRLLMANHGFSVAHDSPKIDLSASETKGCDTNAESKQTV